MNKYLKYGLAVLAGTGILFVLLIVVASLAINPNDYKPQIVQMAKDTKQRELTLAGDIKLSFFPRLGLDLGKASISEFRDEKEFAAVESARLYLSWWPLLRKELVVDQVRIEGVRANIVLFKDDTTNFDDLLAKEKEGKEDKQIHFDIDSVSIDRSALSFRDEMGGRQFELSGIKIKTGRLINGKPTEAAADFNLKADNPQINVHFNVTTGLTFDTEAKLYAVKDLILKIQGEVAGRGLNMDIAGSAQLDLQRKNATADLTSHLDESSIKIKAWISPFANPHIALDLDIDRLDADRYLPAKAPGKQPQPEKPFDFSILKTLNASGSVRVGSLKLNNIQAGNVQMEFKAAGGRLDINPLEADLYQGKASGAVSLTAAGPRITARQNIAGVSIAPLLKDALNKDILEGRGSVTFDLHTEGGTVSAMKKTLQGKAGFNLRDGAIKGINIAAMLRETQAGLGALKGEKVQTPDMQEKTDFSELSASFDINRGVAHNEDLSGKSPLLRVSGNGDIDIGAELLNYLARATVVGSLEGQGGRELTALNGVTVPVRITGPFAEPKLTLDFNALVTESVRQEVETRATDMLQEGLKGLFR